MAAGRQDCSICMDGFKNPKLISCHHSFCCNCLEDYVRDNLHNGRFNCPICRASVELPVGGVSALQSNFYIDTDAGDKFACDICGPKNVASSRCLDCEENLCQSCCYVHEKSKALRHHKICDLGTLDSETKGNIRQRIFCDQHPEDEIRLFCRDCQALICFMCKVVKHENHATEPVSDAAAEMKRTLETKVNECSDKLRRVEASKKKGEELDKIITDAEQEELNAVDEQGSQLCKAIVQELEKVKTRIKNVYHDLRQRNADFTRDVDEEFKTCSNARDNAQTLTYQGTDIDIIKKGPDVKELISAAISKTVQTSDMRLENKLFSPVEIKHGDLISLLGTMEDSTEEEGKKNEREEMEKQEREEKEKHEREERERKEKEEKQINEWSKGMTARVKALEEELSNTKIQYEKTKADAITKGKKLTQAENEMQALRNQHAYQIDQSKGMTARVKAFEEELSNTRMEYEKTKADAITKGKKLTQAENEIQALRNQHAYQIDQSNRMQARVKALDGELSNTRMEYEKTKADANTKGLMLTQKEMEIQSLRNQIADYDSQEEENDYEEREEENDYEEREEENDYEKRDEMQLQASPSMYMTHMPRRAIFQKHMKEIRHKHFYEEKNIIKGNAFLNDCEILGSESSRTGQVSQFNNSLSTSSSPFGVRSGDTGGAGGLLWKPITSSFPSPGPFGKPASTFSQLSSTHDEQQSWFGQQSNYVQSYVGQSTYGQTSVQASSISSPFPSPTTLSTSGLFEKGSIIGGTSFSMQGPNTGFLASGNTGFGSPFGSQQTQNSAVFGGSCFGQPITVPLVLNS